MALPNWQRTIVTETGNVIQNAEIKVVNEATGLDADIFSDRDGLVELSNPFFTGSDGFAQFYTSPGEYRVTAIGPNGQVTWRYEVLSGTASIRDVGTGSTQLPSNGDLEAGAFLSTSAIESLVLDALRPVGSQYRMVAVAEDNDPAVAFPVAERPETLFPGTTWELLWDSSSVYFRTEGTLADDGRVDGLQPDAMQRITAGASQFFAATGGLTNVTGAFDWSTESTNTGGGGDVQRRVRLTFDNADSVSPNQAKTNDVETRVRNVLERVYRRTA